MGLRQWAAGPAGVGQPRQDALYFRWKGPPGAFCVYCVKLPVLAKTGVPGGICGRSELNGFYALQVGRPVGTPLGDASLTDVATALRR